MKELRCLCCGRLLAKENIKEGQLEVKCAYCRALMLLDWVGNEVTIKKAIDKQKKIILK